MKTQKWDEVRAGSKIFLADSFTTGTFDDEQITLHTGTYKVDGFFANACRLINEAGEQLYIASFQLTQFQGITA